MPNEAKNPEQIVSDYHSKNSSYYIEDEEKPFVVRFFGGIVRWIFDSIQVIVIALAIFVVFYLFLVSPHTIDGISMQPNFCNHDVILADKFTPRFREYKRGDVIVFKHDETADYIKRIIGIGGDTILIKEGRVYRNGELLDEPYLPAGRLTEFHPGDTVQEGVPYLVPEGKFFVMGDNRPNSTDSRRFGAIDPIKNDIKGRVVVVIWPFNRARLFNNTNVLPINECGAV